MASKPIKNKTPGLSVRLASTLVATMTKASTGKGKAAVKKVEDDDDDEDNKPHGFTVNFQLSQAYAALAYQQIAAAKPKIDPKPALSARLIRRMSQDVNKERKESFNETDPVLDSWEIPQMKARPQSARARLQQDIDRCAEIGRQRRELFEQKRQEKLEEEKEVEYSIHPQGPRVVPKTFWYGLMQKNAKERNNIVKDYHKHDSTFLTNFNPRNLMGDRLQSRSLSRQSVTTTEPVGDACSPALDTPVEKQSNVELIPGINNKTSKRKKVAFETIHQPKTTGVKSGRKTVGSPQLELKQKDKSPSRQRSKSAPPSRKSQKKADEKRPDTAQSELTRQPLSPVMKKARKVLRKITLAREFFGNITDSHLEEIKENRENFVGNSNSNDMSRPTKQQSTTYLYNMCECEQASNKTVLQTLQKRKKVGLFIWPQQFSISTISVVVLHVSYR